MIAGAAAMAAQPDRDATHAQPAGGDGAAAAAPAGESMSLDALREQRRRRARVAERLLQHDAPLLHALDWSMLDEAPSWLALPPASLSMVQRRVGAVLCAPALRLWIERRFVAAARDALGAPFLAMLLATPDLPAMRSAAGAQPPVSRPEEVAPLLQAAGAAVLLASLPDLAMQRAAAPALAPVADLHVGPAFAQRLIGRAFELSRAERGAATVAAAASARSRQAAAAEGAS